MNEAEYRALFTEPQGDQPSATQTKESETRAGRALAYALDIRKFEIELYWKRATYFWTFIGASFAGYGLTFKAGEQVPILCLLFSSLGLMFSVAWFLVNRGSKFWQNNWERHVDLLGDINLGPLYRVIASDASSTNPLTAPGEFSVTKLNQILSFFVSLVWLVLFLMALLPIDPELTFSVPKAALAVITVLAILALFAYGRSSNNTTTASLKLRPVTIVVPDSKD